MEKLITYAFMRSETSLSQHVHDIKLDNPIKWAQERVKEILGDPFYTDFVNNYNLNQLSPDYSKLYDPYIKQYIAWQAKELYLPEANVQNTATGMRVFTEDSSEVASEQTMGAIIAYAKQQTQFYKGRLLKFLKNNQGLYPLYPTSSCGSSAGLTSGFHITKIGGNHGRC